MSHLPFRNFVHFSQEEAYALMKRVLSGEMPTEGIVEVLSFLRRKSETVVELVGFASAIRDVSPRLFVDQEQESLLDTCGTGGDGTNTFNVSTAAAFVIAGAGQRVAKHGNRRISSQCGSADVLEALGVPVDLEAEQVVHCIAEAGIGFLYAPLLHPAVKHAQEARLAMRGRTVFNLLGPLTNPVRARVQLMGAYSIRAAEVLAHAAARLGIERAFVVHGADGMDEISTTGQTTVFQVEEERVQKGLWSPSDFGIQPATLEDLAGGDPQRNAEIIREVLTGEPGPRRDIVVANAAAALLLARKAPDLKAAVQVAIDSIDSGAAQGKLNQLIEVAGQIRHEVV